jgi:PAS domain S-box-containing protein
MSNEQETTHNHNHLNARLSVEFALKAARLGVWEVDPQTRIVQWDQRCRELFGIKGDLLHLDEVVVHIHPDDREWVAKARSLAMTPGYGGEYDVTYRTIGAEDQVLRWVRFTGKAEYDSSGNMSRFSGIAQEVTREKQDQQQVQTSEAHFRELIQQAPFAMAVYRSRDLIIDIANQAMIGLWGKTASVIGMKLADALPELEGQPFIGILENVFDTGEIYQTDQQEVALFVSGELKTFWFKFTYQPLTDVHGRVYAILNMAVEITEQVKARQKIADSEKRLSGAIELAELATWTLHIKENKFRYSPRFIDWLGLDQDYLNEKEAYNPVPESHRQMVAEGIAEALKSGGIYKNEHPIINRVTGRRRIIQAYAQVFYDDEGNPDVLNGTARDITEQRKIEITLEQLVQQRTEELETSNEELSATNEELSAMNEEFAATNDDLAEANHLLSMSNQNLEQFAYIASHDLQEPLRKIQQFGDLLKKKYESPSDQALTYLERMQSAASRMSVLITDLLTFARVSNNKLNFEQVSLNDLISMTLSDLELRIQETSAKIKIESLPVVHGDKVQLGQLFQNLLSNALKFRKAEIDPEIHIYSEIVRAADVPSHVKPTRWTKSYHRVSVADNGIGFDQQYAARIFQAFQRLHGKSEFEGTGIGLAICEKVAANHGGAITASGEPGEGAVFDIYLPTGS